MSSYAFLMDLALILLSTKVFGLLTKRIHMPQVVGALVAGLILGPAMLNIIHETDFIKQLSEVGVIVLMFCAGLETDIDELKRSGKASFIIALMGVIIPLIGGFLVAFAFNRPGMIESDVSTSIFLQNVFIGVILTATSVSISVETLKEMGKLNTKAGNAILGAAIIDDILGIIALTLITSMADTSVKIGVVLLKILGFLVMVAVAGLLVHRLYKQWVDRYKGNMRRFVIAAFVICLLMAYCSEVFFGVADITGAFFAGLIITKTTKTSYVAKRFDTLSYILLSPVFFASIGLQVDLPNMTSAVIWFSVALVVVAILTKILGCGLGAKMCHFKNKDCVRVGVGMISRGEVALIVASKGNSIGLMSQSLLGPVVIVVVLTTIVAPVFLKIAFTSRKKGGSAESEVPYESELISSYNEQESWAPTASQGNKSNQK
ncbi:sodium:proton antiporter [Blautia sp. An249]|uniref:cation:proton antiporter n=1 Tax=Blautia sp. An249 TaxID=1965603 RepID=UPI000B3808F7|nr:cation:proton antiporter [Blautia sp. An249]OUO77354.1 sodium:proton antiporter [Blautia sp. An249]